MLVIVFKSDGFDRECHKRGCEEQAQQQFQLERELMVGCGAVLLQVCELVEQRRNHNFVEHYDQEHEDVDEGDCLILLLHCHFVVWVSVTLLDSPLQNQRLLLQHEEENGEHGGQHEQT